MSDKKFCLQCDDGTLLVHGAKDVTINIDTLGVCRTFHFEGKFAQKISNLDFPISLEGVRRT